jgi:hypothetical protein
VWEKALELASGITHPVSVAAFALVLATFALVTLKGKIPRIAWLLVSAIVVLGLSPLAASTFLTSRGVYHIRIVVLEPGGQPVDRAEVSSSSGGEIKKADKNWEYDLPPQSRPSDDKVSLFASVRDAYLYGSTSVPLTQDFYPTAVIRLQPTPPVSIRGVVTDEHGRSVMGASVSIPGYPDIATTDQMGNFSLPARSPTGQLVQVRAQKGSLATEVSVITGQSAELVLRAR